MGRIRSSNVKNLAEDLVKANPDKFSDNFQTNKEIVEENVQTQSKKIRNVLAGYITRIVNKMKR